MVSSMYNEGRNILLIVEGADDEVNLFKKIIQCFPEIKLEPENILVYNTNLWVLNEDLIKEFGENWHELEDIDFRVFCESKFPEIKGKKISEDVSLSVSPGSKQVLTMLSSSGALNDII